MSHFIADNGDDSPDENKETVEKMGELENTARKLGLYLNGFVIARTAEDAADPVGDQQIVATFFVGEEAFDDRVQHPDRYQDDDTFRHLTATVDPAADLAEELRKRAEDGKDIFGDDE